MNLIKFIIAKIVLVIFRFVDIYLAKIIKYSISWPPFRISSYDCTDKNFKKEKKREKK